MGNTAAKPWGLFQNIDVREGRLTLLCYAALVLLCCSCGTAPPAREQPEDFWKAEAGGLVFFGAAALRRDSGESVRLALEDAARRAAMFGAVRGRFVSRQVPDSGFFDYSRITENSLSHDTDYQKYIDGFTFSPEGDVLRLGGLVFVRARLPSPPPLPLGPQSAGGAAKPRWIDQPPSFPGRLTGIGYAGKRMSPADSIRASYENAAFSIIRIISSGVQGSITDTQGSPSLNPPSSGGITISAEAALKEFYILDFWIDPKDQSVWTLAAAKPANDN
jgi:hypothetical protein